jgi:hypothetical protein
MVLTLPPGLNVDDIQKTEEEDVSPSPSAPRRGGKKDLGWTDLPVGVEIHVRTTYDSVIGLIRSRSGRAHVACFRCGEGGHKKSECFHWKVKKCWNKFNCDPSICSFAHSDEELRTPWVSKCIRIIKKDGLLQKVGCEQIGHTYKQCPLRQELGDAAAPTLPSRPERREEREAADETRCTDCSQEEETRAST